VYWLEHTTSSPCTTRKPNCCVLRLCCGDVTSPEDEDDSTHTTTKHNCDALIGSSSPPLPLASAWPGAHRRKQAKRRRGEPCASACGGAHGSLLTRVVACAADIKVVTTAEAGAAPHHLFALHQRGLESVNESSRVGPDLVGRARAVDCGHEALERSGETKAEHARATRLSWLRALLGDVLCACGCRNRTWVGNIA
jgi:hypothetical protein